MDSKKINNHFELILLRISEWPKKVKKIQEINDILNLAFTIIN